MKTRTILLVASFILASVANAYDFCVDGIYYTINHSGDNTCSVAKGPATDQTIDLQNPFVGVSNDYYKDEVVIPETVQYNNITYTVTRIGFKAFIDCINLTSVVMPSTITEIDDWAFDNCRSLTAVQIPESVTTIGELAFYNCIGLTQINLPEGLEVISESLFEDCESLASITIPSTVTRIEDSAFYGCTSLELVVNKSMTPQRISKAVFSRYGTLHVLESCVSAYQDAQNWKNFNIVGVNEKGEVSVGSIPAQNSDACSAVYSLDGTRISQLQKGINIIKMSDNTVRKIYCK